MAVFEVQAAVLQYALPRKIDGDKLYVAKFIPVIVTKKPADDGEFIFSVKLIIGASNVN
jgi:hypothetical protein